MTPDDPYAVLGVSPDADDEAVRRAYLALVREHPPERSPERFAAVRAAYETLRDADNRLARRLFDAGRGDGLEQLIEEVACRSPRRRPTLAELLAAARR